MNILYILKLRDDPLIKIGVSSKISFEWLYALLRTYKVSLKDSYLISANERQTVIRLKSEILQQYGQYKPSKRQLKKYDNNETDTYMLKWDCQDAIVDLIKAEGKDSTLGIRMITLDEMM